MIKVLYSASSSYSGSTLIAFLLNSHPEMFSIGHTEGWPFEKDEEFFCSCGESLESCPFYRGVKEAFHREGLPFDLRNFGNEYRLAANDRLNRYLTGPLPLLPYSSVERARDALVRLVPPWAATLARQDKANATLIRAGLSFSGASIFVDGAQDPFRIRHLRRNRELELSVIHLVRDVRGVVFSNMVKRNWDVAFATGIWLRQQRAIARVAGECGNRMVVHYEDLCDDTQATLSRICQFAGIPDWAVSGGFKQGEHHILGNVMRFGSGEIKRSARWEKELAPSDRQAVQRIVAAFAQRHPRHSVAAIVRRYLDAD